MFTELLPDKSPSVPALDIFHLLNGDPALLCILGMPTRPPSLPPFQHLPIGKGDELCPQEFGTSMYHRGETMWSQ